MANIGPLQILDLPRHGGLVDLGIDRLGRRERRLHRRWKRGTQLAVCSVESRWSVFQGRWIACLDWEANVGGGAVVEDQRRRARDFSTMLWIEGRAGGRRGRGVGEVELLSGNWNSKTIGPRSCPSGRWSMNVRPRGSRFVWGCTRSRDQLRWKSTCAKPVIHTYIHVCP